MSRAGMAQVGLSLGVRTMKILAVERRGPGWERSDARCSIPEVRARMAAAAPPGDVATER
jgi:hypothetical protein